MAGKSLDWRSFWDLVAPEEVALILTEWYGPAAADAAFSGAAAALADNRDADFSFWMAVLASVRAGPRPPETGPH